MKILSLNEIRKSQLETMCIFRDFCEKNNLKYYLACGTLLGAVRHKGFIPWDDDVDIYMPRKDYDYLIDNFNHNTVNNRELISKETNPEFYCNYTKIVDYNTVTIELGQTLKIGVWIDIFPLEYMKDNIKHIPLKTYHIGLLNTFLYLISLKSDTKRSKWKNNIIKIINMIIPTKDNFTKYITNKRNNLIQNLRTTKESNTYGLLYKDFGIWGVPTAPKEMFEPSIKLEFEKELFDVPNNYNDILRYSYGKDYMKIPPKEKQYSHSYTCYWREEK